MIDLIIRSIKTGKKSVILLQCEKLTGLFFPQILYKTLSLIYLLIYFLFYVVSFFYVFCFYSYFYRTEWKNYAKYGCSAI